MTLLTYGPRGDDIGADARCDARLAPLGAAIDVARKGFRTELRPLQDLLSQQDKGASIASIPTKDFRAWGEALALWTFRFSALSHPPESFDKFPPPPVPEFAQFESSSKLALPGSACSR
ncbi:unnamed protein product, partial [Pylaiella littoralis]